MSDRQSLILQDLEEQYGLLAEYNEIISLAASPLERVRAEREKRLVENSVSKLEQELNGAPPPIPQTYLRQNYVNLPDPDRALIGREEALHQLGKLLANGGCVAVCGVPGQGKTAFAHAYLKSFLEKDLNSEFEIALGQPTFTSFEAIIWLTLEGNGTDLSKLAELLGRNSNGNPNEIAEDLRQYLTAHPLLLVLDNLDVAIKEGDSLALDVAALLQKVAELRGKSQIIVTTREFPKQYHLKVFMLDGLSNEAGADLLAEQGLNEEARPQLLMAVEKAKGNPFALRLLADLVTDPFTGDTLENLLEQGHLWDVELADRLLRKTWETRLKSEERDLLQILALLRPPARRPTLVNLIATLAEVQVQQLLGGLAHKSLVTAVSDSKDNKKILGYDLHPLFRRFISTEMANSPALLSELHHNAALYFRSLIPTLPAKEGYLRKVVADAWAILEAVYHLNEVGDYQAACDLFFAENLPEALDRWGQAALRLEIYTRWADLDTPSRLSEPGSKAKVLHYLADAYCDLGQVERGINYDRQALAISREIGERQTEGSVLGNLGLAYAALGQAEEAVKYHRQALVIFQEIGDRVAEGGQLGDLANAYRNLGQIEQAIEFYQQALMISRETGDRRTEGNHLGNLGVAYRNLRQIEQAIEFYQQALAISCEIGDRRGQGNRLGNLGNAYRDLGQKSEASNYYHEALAIFREIGDRRAEGAALGNLGSICGDMGQSAEALNFYHQALMISHEIGDERTEAIQLANLGSAYRESGEAIIALAYLRLSVEICQKIKSPFATKIQSLIDEQREKQTEKEFNVNWAESEAVYQKLKDCPLLHFSISQMTAIRSFKLASA